MNNYNENYPEVETSYIEIDLSKFGAWELKQLEELLREWRIQNIKGFGEYNLRVGYNMQTGSVFLIDEDYPYILMINGKGLEPFYSCVNCGVAGFLEDLEEFNMEESICLECERRENEN